MTTASLTAGTQSLIAEYGGDSTFAGSSSAAVSLTVSGAKPDFAIAVAPTMGSVAAGAPATATVPVGTTVTWTNRDDIPHNVVSPEQKFKSPVLDTDEKFSHTFDVAGTYKYYCSIHPRMTGEVVVR